MVESPPRLSCVMREELGPIDEAVVSQGNKAQTWNQAKMGDFDTASSRFSSLDVAR